MNKYYKIYNQLINKTKNRDEIFGTYYEKHHILPKSLGGTNTKENIVKLTGREHYISHLLLWKSYPIGSIERKKMAYAANQMRRLVGDKVNGKIYERLKLEHSENVKKDKKGNKYCFGLGHCIKNINTEKITRLKIGAPIPKNCVKWMPTKKRKLCYHDPITDKEYRFEKDRDAPKNLIKGRCESFRNKVKITSVGNSSNRGMIKIHNPITKETKHVLNKLKIPDGFVIGMSKESREKLSKSCKGRKASNTGMFRYHHIKTDKVIQLMPTDKIPEGFIRGMPPSFSQKTKTGMDKTKNVWLPNLIKRNKS